MNDDGKSDAFEKLAGLAAEANIVRAVHALPGGSSFAAYVQNATAAYWASHDDDSGLLKWLQDRWAGAQMAWANDVATVTGEMIERPPPRIEVEAPPASAIRAAGEAMRRAGERDEEAGPSHMGVLLQAVLARRGPFVERLEREMAAGLASGATDLNAYIAPMLRGPLRDLFRRDVEAAIREAEGK
jgi:hypothetical protein